MHYPLSDLKVLDLSRVLAGPFAGRMLADLGADVVKVEPPEGDVTRLWGTKVGSASGYFSQQNVSKRGLCIDLKSDAGRELVTELAGRADLVIENFRPGVMQRLGVGYESLKANNPGLIMLSISGFGQQGPESSRAAYAPVIHAEVGFIDRQGEDSKSYPTDMTLSIADTNASLHGLVALLSALHLRGRTGEGQHIDLAMIDASLVTDDQLHYFLEPSAEAQRQNNEVWQTAAGPLILAGDFRYIWRCLQKFYGAEDGTAEGADLQQKIRARRAWAEDFFTATCSTRAAVIEALDRMNIAWGDVRSGATITEQPTVAHRKTITSITDRAGRTRPVTQTPYRFSQAKSGVRGPAPQLGEHNREVLKDWLCA